MKLRDLAFLSILLSSLLTIIPTAHAQLPPGLYSECDFCSCSMGISPLTMCGSAVRFDTRYTELSREFSNGTGAPNPTNAKETYFTNVLSLSGQMTDGLCATLMVPFAHKVESSTDPVNSLANISNSGIGDISLIARYTLIEGQSGADTRILAASTGVKFANGSTALLNNGAPADPDVQLGTGTTDFFAGLGYLAGFGDWNFEADALALIRGFGNGAAGHVYGDNVNYDLTGTYRVHQTAGYSPSLMDPTLFAAFGVRGEWRGYEEQNGQPLNNDALGWSGGNVIYLAPGAQIFFTQRLSLDATVWVPVIHALNGNQLGETVKVLAGLQLGL